MEFGRDAITQSRNSGVSTVPIAPRAPDCRSPSVKMEKERSVADDGASDVITELISPEDGDRGFKNASRGERVILKVIRQAAVKIIRTRFCDHRICAPLLRPSTAEKLLAVTRTSSTESAFGVKFVMPPRAAEFTLLSSTVKLLASVRWPLAYACGPASPENESLPDPPAPSEDEMPFPDDPRLKGDQIIEISPVQRDFAQLRPSIRPETRPCSVSTSGSWAVTVTLSLTEPSRASHPS